MKMQILDLNKMGLSEITETDKKNIEGGKFWAIHDAIGYVLGVIVGTSLNVAKATATKLFEHTALK